MRVTALVVLALLKTTARLLAFLLGLIATILRASTSRN